MKTVININNFEALLFDLDGTLIDSAPDIAAALNLALEHNNLPTYEIETIRSWIGNGAEKLLERALISSGMKNINDVFPTLKRSFFDFYGTLNGDYSTVYPGVHEALNLFHERDLKLACVTNKPAAFSGELLSKKDLKVFFPVLLSGDDVIHKKPAPDMLYTAARRLGVRPENCLVVGDSENDVLAAQAAKMKICAVSYGYDQGIDLSNLGVDIMVASITELIV